MSMRSQQKSRGRFARTTCDAAPVQRIASASKKSSVRLGFSTQCSKEFERTRCLHEEESSKSSWARRDDASRQSPSRAALQATRDVVELEVVAQDECKA